MFTTYASILALATAVLSAPLANPACGAGVPVVTVTTYVTGYPPAAASSTSTSVAAPPSPTPGAFYENVSPNPAKPNPPTTLSTLTTSSSPVAPPPPPPPATYEPAPNPPKTTTTKAPNPEPTYGASPPPPPPPPPPPKTNNPPPQSGSGNKGTRSMTPHDKYSSSIGVVGCKVNTNRIAYWPERPVISRYCVKVTHGGQSLHLLHIDQSEGANDMSYDAWNVLVSGGKSATESPHCGGGVDMEYEWVDNSECADLILDGSGKLPLIATNPEFCLGTDNPDQYVTLWNFKDLRCEMGVDEQCKVPDYKAGLNQAICPSGLGVSSAKTDCAVKDIPYVNTPTCAIAS